MLVEFDLDQSFPLLDPLAPGLMWISCCMNLLFYLLKAWNNILYFRVVEQRPVRQNAPFCYLILAVCFNVICSVRCLFAVCRSLHMWHMSLGCEFCIAPQFFFCTMSFNVQAQVRCTKVVPIIGQIWTSTTLGHSSRPIILLSGRLCRPVFFFLALRAIMFRLRCDVHRSP